MAFWRSVSVARNNLKNQNWVGTKNYKEKIILLLLKVCIERRDDSDALYVERRDLCVLK
jgi:hypothetical protein